MENIGVAQLMLVKFAPENVPQLSGLSVHNQRIERLWRDVVTYIVQYQRDNSVDKGNNVVVPSCPFQLSGEEISTLNEIDVFPHDGNIGINIYLQVVNLLRTFESVE